MANTNPTPKLDALNASIETNPAMDALTDAVSHMTGLRTKTVYSIGHWGTSYRGTSGDKRHLIATSIVTAPVNAGASPAWWGQRLAAGDTYSVHACTGGNKTAPRASIIEGADTDTITCAACLKRLARLTA
jgi:hypothetical protein